MEAAKSRKTAFGQRQNPHPDRYLAVILREITGKEGEKDAAAKLRSFVDDGSLVLYGWICRGREIVKAIERESWDLAAVAKLANLPTLSAGDDAAVVEHLNEIRHELRGASRTVATLNRLLTQEAASATGLLQHPKLARRILCAWLSLEIKLRPDERGLLAGLRDRLICEAERREIDLRGLGI